MTNDLDTHNIYSFCWRPTIGGVRVTVMVRVRERDDDRLELVNVQQLDNPHRPRRPGGLNNWAFHWLQKPGNINTARDLMKPKPEARSTRSPGADNRSPDVGESGSEAEARSSGPGDSDPEADDRGSTARASRRGCASQVRAPLAAGISPPEPSSSSQRDHSTRLRPPCHSALLDSPAATLSPFIIPASA